MPQGRDIPLLLLGIIGISISGPLIALSTMPILTLIFWRNLGGTLLVAPFGIRNLRGEAIFSKNRRAALWSIAAGISLVAHFIGFFIAMRFTSVAAGTALTALQPLFTAYFMVRLGGHIPKRAWVGMVISFSGVLIITGIDFTISTRAFVGDLAAISSAVTAALYVTFGAHAQRSLSTMSYATICYFTVALCALPFALFIDGGLTSYPLHEWKVLIALIFFAQILGHTMYNLTLKRVSPAIVSLIIFFEPPGSALFAYILLGQLPPAGTVPGMILLLVGCLIFVVRTRSKVETSTTDIAGEIV